MDKKRVNYSSIGYNLGKSSRQYGNLKHSKSINRQRAVHSSQKRRSLDAINRKPETIRLNNTEIDFKRDKLAYLSKYQSQINYNPGDYPQKSNNNHQVNQQSTIIHDQYDDNLKVSLKKYQKLIQSNNEIMKNIVREQILSELILKDPIMKKINKDLVQSLILIGKLKIYEEEQVITRNQQMIGFLFYGKAKIYNKDYRNIIERGDTFGEHNLFQYSISLKIKCIQDTCIFWLPLKYYLILREQSIKNGLKQQFSQLQIVLRLSFIKKKYKETIKKSHA